MCYETLVSEEIDGCGRLTRANAGLHIKGPSRQRPQLHLPVKPLRDSLPRVHRNQRIPHPRLLPRLQQPRPRLPHTIREGADGKGSWRGEDSRGQQHRKHQRPRAQRSKPMAPPEIGLDRAFPG